MEYFTGWAAKLGDALVGLIPGAHAILLRKSDDTLDMLTSDGSGAALVAPTGGDQPSKSDSALTTLVDNVALPAAGAFTTTDYVAIPAGARRVTFVVKYTKHASATTGQWKARMAWKWSATVTDVCEPFVDANSQTIAEPKVALKSYCQDISGPKYSAGTPSGLMQLTFEVPAGVVGGILQLAELSDTTNKGTVSLFAATSEVL